jgi:ribosomal protein S18 acetylase RimI-like enzyme
MKIRTAFTEDSNKIKDLYKSVAKSEGGIIRVEEEITDEYISGCVQKAIETGLILVAEYPEETNQFIAEIHAYKSGIRAFDHVLTDLTLVVRPEFQARKIGRTIFTIFLEEIAKNRPDVGRVELIVRESNLRAIALYQSLGFNIEGRLEMRVRTAQSDYETDIPMGWQNPNYEFL